MFSSRFWFLRRVTAMALLLVAPCIVVRAADPPGWAGTYFTKKHLNGKASFQLGIQQSGNSLLIAFNAAYHDGHDVAPEAQGTAKVAGKDTLEFQFRDNFRNTGSGKIRRAGDGIIVDFVFAQPVDKRCLVFYERNMHLKRAGK
ncbi:MAG TPA: hypothetical protein VEX43_07800 [Chthoniobacterales bacterium]|nr:hypothetical protein [Chthoniobacterales bacterium]